jgi:Amt family ammonium transporter
MKRFFVFTLLVFTLLSGWAFAEEHANPPPTPATEQAAPAQLPAPSGEAAPAVEAAPVSKIDSGDTAWMIVATALVMLMTLPGLALFYGGLAKRKDTLNTMAMSFVTY